MLLGLSDIQAQKTVTASGGDANGGNGSMSYSIGQIVYTTSIGTNGNTMAKGVQQSYEISLVNDSNITIDVKIYPNPTSYDLTLETDNSSSINQSYYILDVEGRLIKTNKITSSKTIIKMSSFSNGVYFINVFDADKEIKVFKVIKLNK